ncbi:MAG: hypothetical protein ACTHJS_01900 [Xanthobacteraceae bacterium]
MQNAQQERSREKCRHQKKQDHDENGDHDVAFGDIAAIFQWFDFTSHALFKTTRHGLSPARLDHELVPSIAVMLRPELPMSPRLNGDTVTFNWVGGTQLVSSFALPRKRDRAVTANRQKSSATLPQTTRWLLDVKPKSWVNYRCSTTSASIVFFSKAGSVSQEWAEIHAIASRLEANRPK